MFAEALATNRTTTVTIKIALSLYLPYKSGVSTIFLYIRDSEALWEMMLMQSSEPGGHGKKC